MNPDNWFATRSSTITAWLAALVCCGVAALAWFGFRAADEWQRSSTLLVDRRADEVANMLSTALVRDMRAVQTGVLDGREWGSGAAASPYEVTDLVAGAFARYPYPEEFFAWQTLSDKHVFFARTDRTPPWLAPPTDGGRYPVQVRENDELAGRLLGRIARDIRDRKLHSTFDVDIGGVPYQVVARPLYRSGNRDEVDGGFAYLVNLDWTRQNYFSDLTTQVARVAQAGAGMVSTVVDETGTSLPGLPATRTDGPLKSRPFPVLFFEPSVVAIDPPRDLSRRVWAVHVSAASDPTLTLAARGARRTLVVVAAGALTLGLGLFITVRAARAVSDVAAMRSDFVSTVTHELKTPVQVIRGIGETLIRGRVSTAERLHEYAQLLVQEGHRLSRLIDNLLAYSRVTDVAQAYSFEPQRPTDVVDEALKGFHRLIVDSGFRVDIDVPPSLPAIRGDRTSMVLALDNLIDNAMRYSGTSRDLSIRGSAVNGTVELAIIDHGCGIPGNELEHVQRRFARGRSTKEHGSGLGLAIVNRIASDHGGSLRLESEVGIGTTAILSLPRAGA